MRARTAAPALLLVLILITTGFDGGAVARAQSDVEQARDEAEDARREVEEANRLVDEQVANRDEVEDRLAQTLDRYEETAIALSEVGGDLTRITDQLAEADAAALGLELALGQQIITAYVEAVAATGVMMWSSESVEHALVVGTTLETGSADTTSSLERLATYRRELENLQGQLEGETERYEQLKAELDEQSAELEALFAEANADVADAFGRARQADAEYQAALDDVARAQAAEEARRREEEARRRAEAAATTTTSPPRTTSSPSTTTPATTAPSTTAPPSTTSSSSGGSAGTTAPTTTSTTTAPPPPPTTSPGNFRPGVERWRGLVAAHFPASRVDQALVIMQCESGGDPDARNPYSGASGLFQFMPGTWAASSVKAGVGDRSVFDGEANIIAAAWLGSYYESRGYDFWRPWSCRRHL